MNGELIDPSRRVFFRRLFSQTTQYLSVVHEELHGRPQMRLLELDRFPDSVLRQITPVFNSDLEYQLNEASFYIRSHETGDFVELLRLEDRDFDILSLFDRDLTLEQIAGQIEKKDFAEETVYSRVKILFLSLARCAVCHPAQSLADVELGAG